MDFYETFMILAILGGFLMAFSLGANDAANAMASAVGAKALTLRQAVVVAGLMNFTGAVFLGGAVVATVSKGIVDTSSITDPHIIILGMFAALLTAGFFVLVSTMTGFPVSSTHAVVGGMMGFGIAAIGFDAVYWGKMISIFLTWIISPILGGLVAFGVHRLIRLTLLDKPDLWKAAKRYCPMWMGFTAALIVVEVIIESDVGKELVDESRTLASLCIVFFALFVWSQGKLLVDDFLSKMEKHKDAVENVFRRLQIFTSSYVALAIGSNDVANAFGPVLGIYLIAKYHNLADHNQGAVWLLVLGGIGIAVGCATLGHRVIKTVGSGITKLNNTKGYSVDFSLATTVLACSQLGIPVSSTTVAVGAVTGVGLSQGSGGVNFKKLLKIVAMWLITIPISATVSGLFFYLLKYLFD